MPPVGVRSSVVTRRPGRLDRRGGSAALGVGFGFGFGLGFGARGCGGGRLGAAAFGGAAVGARLRAAEDGWRAGAAAGAAAGADRDDLGVTHGRSLRPGGARRSGVRAAARRARPSTRSARPPVGRERARRSRRTPRRSCTRGSKPSSVAHPGGVDAATVGQEARVCSGEKSATRAERSTEPTLPTANAGSGDGRPLQAAQRLGEHQDAVAGDVEGAGDVGERRRAAARRAGRCSCRNCSRGVEAEHGRDDRQPEVRRERAGHAAGRSRWRARSMRHPDVGAAAGEPADVALDLGDVLGVARARRRGAAPCPR